MTIVVMSLTRYMTRRNQALNSYQIMTNVILQALGQESIINAFKDTSSRCKLSPTSSRRFSFSEPKKLEHYSYTPPKVMAMDEFTETTSVATL